MKAPINILYIHQEGSITGSAISLRNLLANLDRTEIFPRVLMGGEGPARALFEEEKIPVDVINIRPFWTAPGPKWFKLGYFFNFLAFLPNPLLRDYLKIHKPDIIHINDKSMLSAGLTASKLMIPVVWHLRSTYFSSNSKIQAKLSRKFIRQIASELIAISEDEIDGFENLGNLTIVYNSVDFNQVEKARKKREKVRLEFGLEKNEIAIGQISNKLSSKRGTWDYIRALGYVNKWASGDKLKYFVIGNANTTDRIEKNTEIGLKYHKLVESKAYAGELAEELGISERLILTGYRHDILSVIAAMDIFVVCNQLGALGRMPLEALALGRPLVATAGHNPKNSILHDGKTGLIAPTNSPKSIASEIVKLIEDVSLRVKLSAQGSKFARDNFDPPKNAAKVMRIYQKVLEKSSQGQ